MRGRGRERRKRCGIIFHKRMNVCIFPLLTSIAFSIGINYSADFLIVVYGDNVLGLAN